MATFDQRNQSVKHQFNAGGNINFGTVENRAELIQEFKKLQSELNSDTAKGLLEDNLSLSIEAKIKDIIKQIESSKPDRKGVLEYLQEAKELLGGIASATGLIKILAEATEVIRRLL